MENGKSFEKIISLETTTGRELVGIVSVDGGRESGGQDRRPYLVFEQSIQGDLAPVGIYDPSGCAVRTTTGEHLPLTSGPGSEFVVE